MRTNDKRRKLGHSVGYSTIVKGCDASGLVQVLDVSALTPMVH